jgi:peptide/nickel transport system permease protein
MGRYVLRRFLVAVPTLIGISLISFLIIALAPGDAVTAMMGAQEGVGSAQVAEELRARLGLNDPLPIRYVRWLSQVAQGNLGVSMVDNQSVTGTIGVNLSLTLQLTVPSFLIGILIAVVLGAWTGFRPYSRFDGLVSFVSMVLMATPSFVLALILLYFLAIRTPLFPAGGTKDVFGLEAPTLVNHLKYFVLPVSTLSVLTAANIIRYVRDGVIAVRTEDYVRTARAKGLPERTVLVSHVLRNALLPVVTIASLNIPSLISGALLVETVFGWGGVGTRVYAAISQRDVPVIMAVTLLTGLAALAANLLADLVYAVVDPRIRLG